jgi:ankyrin repeat protein
MRILFKLLLVVILIFYTIISESLTATAVQPNNPQNPTPGGLHRISNLARGSIVYLVSTTLTGSAVSSLLYSFLYNPLIDYLFFTACTHEYIIFVEILAEYVNVYAEHGENKETPLHAATKLGSGKAVRVLLDRRPAPDKDAFDMEEYNTPLHLAAWFNHRNIVKMLIKESAQVNVKNKNRDTPLHHAAELGQIKVMELLLEDGKAEVDIKNIKNSIPLHLAALNGHLEAVELLLKYKSNANTKDLAGETPLHKAINPHNSQNNSLQIISFLIQHGSDVNAQDDSGNTALHKSSEDNYAQIVYVLVTKHNASVNIKNNLGETPLTIAFKNDYAKIVNFLTQHSTPIDIPMKRKNGSSNRPLASPILTVIFIIIRNTIVDFFENTATSHPLELINSDTGQDPLDRRKDEL